MSRREEKKKDGCVQAMKRWWTRNDRKVKLRMKASKDGRCEHEDGQMSFKKGVQSGVCFIASVIRILIIHIRGRYAQLC